MKIKLAPKFVAIVSFLVILTSFSLSFFFVRHESEVIRTEHKERAVSVGRNFAYSVEYGILTKNYEILDKLIAGVMKEKDIIWVEIKDEEGKIWASSGEKREPLYETEFPVITKKMEREKEGILFEEGKEVDKEEIFFQEEPIEQEEKIATVRLGMSLAGVYKRLDEIRKRAIIITAMVIAIAVAITFIMARAITTPLKELVSATEKVSDGSLEVRAEIKTGDEIGELAASFNKMTESLQRTTVSKDYTNSIIKSMVDTLIVVNPDATIRTVNQATLDLLGYSEDELIGQPVGTIFEEEEEEEVLFKGTRLEKLLREGSVRDYDMTYLTKDKERIPVSFSGSVMRKPRTDADKDTDKHREIVGIVGVARDMREIKRFMEKEKELAAAVVETEKKRVAELEKSQDASLNIMEDLDRRRKELDAALKEIKETQSKLIHASKLEAVGTLSSNIAHTIGNMIATLIASSSGNREEITKLKCIQSLDKLFENSQTLNEVYEEYHKIKLGSREEFGNLRSKYIRQIDDLFEQSRDINEARQKYQETRKEMLSTAYSRIYSYSEEIFGQTNLMSENIKNLLYFARTHKPEQREVNLNEILNTARSLLSAHKRIEFIENCAPDLPVIIADGNQLSNVFTNIILNGIEAMPEGGKLIYGTRVAGTSDDQQVEAYITDTGTGIPKENINKIFTPFFTTKEKGSGLGLSRVYDIIEKHNGKIDVKSNAQGTTFSIKLPVEQGNR